MNATRHFKVSKATCLLPIFCVVSILAYLFYRNFFLNEPLWMAAYGGNVQDVQSLLDRGADPNSNWGEDGSTAIHIAKQRGHIDVVNVLRKAGAKE